MFLSCTETKSDSVSNKIIENFTSKSGQLEQDIPGALNSEAYNGRKQSLEKRLGLSSLKSGFDRFQIRIWKVTGPFTGDLYVFKNEPDSEWRGAFYEYKYIPDHTQKMDSVVIKKSILPKPKSGWNSFINKLYNLHALILPHWESVPGYDQVGNNEGGIAIEISSKTKYRIYAYLTPYERQDVFPEAKKIVEIMNLVQNEFDE